MMQRRRKADRPVAGLRPVAERRRLLRAMWFVVGGVLVADQALKFWVKTSFYLGEEVRVFGDWFLLHFTENNGIAFGLSPSGEFGKLMLSLFRIVATGSIGYLIYRLVRQRDVPRGVVVALMFIFAGALGNIIDGTFYGLLFGSSEGYVASGDGAMLLPTVAGFLPAGGGYAPLFHGKVVDMLYFPIIDATLPSWLPVWGGEPFRFFEPVFNLADSAITCAVFYLLIFQWRFLAQGSRDRHPRVHRV